MKTYTVTIREIHTCEVIVQASSKAEAIDKANEFISQNEVETSYRSTEDIDEDDVELSVEE